MADVSAISLSERQFRCRCSLLRCTLPKQAHSIHGSSMHQNENKILSSKSLSSITRLSRHRRRQTILKLIADLYCSQTKLPFLIVTSNPQIIRGNLKGWKITRFGHASRGRENTRINNELRKSLSRNRITATLLREF